MKRENHLDWLDRSPLAAGVVRDERIVYANDAFVALLGCDRSEIVGKHYLTLVAPEHIASVRDRHERGMHGDRDPDTYEFDLIRADKARRRVEIWVSHVHGDTIFQLDDRTDRADDQRRLLDLALLGASVQSEPTPERIDARVAEGVGNLGFLMARVEPKGDGVRIVDIQAPMAIRASFERVIGASLVGMELSWSPTMSVAWSDGIAFMDDVPFGSSELWLDAGPSGRDVLRLGGYRRGILLRISPARGPIQILWLSAPWLRREYVPTLALFGSQIEAALDAAQVIADLSARNASLAALNMIATTAENTAEPADLFASVGAAIEKLLCCDAIGIHMFDQGARVATLEHSHGIPPDARQRFGRLPVKGARLSAIVRDQQPVVLKASDFDAEDRASLALASLETVVLVPMILRSQVIGVISASYSAGKAVRPFDVEILQSAAAHFAAAIEVSRLITDLRHNYADLARTQERLVRRERLAALGELAGAVADRVHQPLGTISKSLDELRSLVPESGERHVLFEILSEETSRLSNIVDALLDFARPVKPILQRTSLTALVDEAVEAALRERTHDGRMRVERAYEPVPAVRVDPRLLRQAILNLALNASQSMEDNGTLRIHVGTRRRDGVAYVRIEVSDTGHGMPPEVIAQIFDPFFTTRATGTGLGLAVVKRIIDEHRGTVSVTSELGAGTTFAIELPPEEMGNEGARATMGDSPH